MCLDDLVVRLDAVEFNGDSGIIQFKHPESNPGILELPGEYIL